MNNNINNDNGSRFKNDDKQPITSRNLYEQNKCLNDHKDTDTIQYKSKHNASTRSLLAIDSLKNKINKLTEDNQLYNVNLISNRQISNRQISNRAF